MRIETKMVGVFFLLLTLSYSASAQKIDGKFKSFYKTFQEAIKTDRLDVLSAKMYFPFQTIYWVDDINELSEEEKMDGLIDSNDFKRYHSTIFHKDVKRLVPQMEIERIQQIDIASSGDYYKKLGQLVDDQSTLYELYCQYAEDSTVGDDYFAFIFGKVNNEYKVLAYYSKFRIKE